MTRSTAVADLKSLRRAMRAALLAFVTAAVALPVHADGPGPKGSAGAAAPAPRVPHGAMMRSFPHGQSGQVPRAPAGPMVSPGPGRIAVPPQHGAISPPPRLAPSVPHRVAPVPPKVGNGFAPGRIAPPRHGESFPHGRIADSPRHGGMFPSRPAPSAPPRIAPVPPKVGNGFAPGRITPPRHGESFPPGRVADSPHHDRMFPPPRHVPSTPHRVAPVPPKVAHAFKPRFVRVLPPHHRVFIHRGARFYFARGFWYRAIGPRFVTVVPPPGFVVDVLPRYYSVFWIGAVPYYYVNNVYYTPTANGYVVTPPPAESITEEPADVDASTSGDLVEEPVEGASEELPGGKLFVYPRQGQSAEQQSRDRRECRDWAVSQTGFDPNTAAAPAETAGNVDIDTETDTDADAVQPADKFADYERALTACLEGRGYTVR